MEEARTNGQIAFDPLKENPRAALLLSKGVLYLTWASSCDVDPYHGWVMAYDPQTLAQRAVLNALLTEAKPASGSPTLGPQPTTRATFTSQPAMALSMSTPEATITETQS